MTSRFIKQSLFAASIITVGANILGRVLGFFREATIAGFYGTSSLFDTFIIAFTLPELLTFIFFAALPLAVIPWLKKSAAQNGVDEADLFWEGLFSFVVILGILTAVVYIFRSQLLFWIAPTLSGEELVRGQHLMGMLAPFVFFRGMEAYFRSCLFNKKHFVIPSISPMIANIVVLFTLYMLYERLNIEALVYSWLLSSVIIFSLNGYAIVSILKPRHFSTFSLSVVKPLLKVVCAVAAVEMIALIYPVVDRYFAATYLGPGQISALRYATFLVHLPSGMFVVSFALASFPWISDYSTPSDREKLRSLYQESIRLILFVLAVVAAGMVLFPTEIARIAFQRGAFDLKSLQLTATPFRYFSAGIVFYSLYFYQMKYYYARSALLRLGVILVAMLIIKVVLSFILVHPMEQNGLALATSITWFCGLVIMTVDLGRILQVSRIKLFFPYSGKVLICLSVTILCWFMLKKVWTFHMTDSFLETLLRILVFGLSGLFLYFGTALILKLPEPQKVYTMIRSRLTR